MWVYVSLSSFWFPYKNTSWTNQTKQTKTQTKPFLWRSPWIFTTGFNCFHTIKSNVVITVATSTNNCGSFPCLNGGACAENTTYPGYTCTCPSLYTGTRCESRESIWLVGTSSARAHRFRPAPRDYMQIKWWIWKYSPESLFWYVLGPAKSVPQFFGHSFSLFEG